MELYGRNDETTGAGEGYSYFLFVCLGNREYLQAIANDRYEPTILMGTEPGEKCPSSKVFRFVSPAVINILYLDAVRCPTGEASVPKNPSPQHLTVQLE